MKIIPTELTLDMYLSEAEQILEIKYLDLLNTPFFVGPLTPQEAIKEMSEYFKDTHPAFVYKQNDQYFCIYP